MPRAGIVVAVLFVGLAIVQFTGVFASDPEPPPPPPVEETPTPVPTETAEPKPFPTITGPRPEPKSYESTEELVDDLAAKGIECSELNYLDQPDPTLSEFSLCDPGTTDFRFNIYMYPSAPNRKLWLDGMKAQKLPVPLAWGPNWIIVAAGEPSTAKERIRSIAAAIGGTIEDFSPKGKKKG